MKYYQMDTKTHIQHTQKQRRDKYSRYQKTLTVEQQNVQMRQMNQRWRKRNATLRADVIDWNVWGMESEE